MPDPNNIYALGFLSPEIDACRERYRIEFAATLQVCEQASAEATKQLFGAKFGRLSDEHILAISLWCRCLSACQGAILLTERGMVPEAQTLVRSAYEFLFFAAASINDPTVFTSLVSGHDYARLEQARAMLRDGQRSGNLNDEMIAKLNALVQDIEPSKKAISAYDAARLAGLEYLHATVYRGLSFVASHATMAATNPTLERADGDALQIVFGPSPSGAEFCLGLIDTCLRTGIPRIESLLIANASGSQGA
ncbi:DUF5677 domain-containing protein [Burkholderia ubonensis]|uniref:DUF5677 domain-containing protein n=1 Tax=Burkholderia ubonensis TaxID=101571 RepID=UPI0012FA03DC|nr:DUF5677 domain-containing protein [Burkholderia ubonensis]